MEASEENTSEAQEVTGGLDENEEALLLGDATNGLDSEPTKDDSETATGDKTEDKTEGKDDEKSEEKPDESKEKQEEKTTTETLLEIDGKKVKKTTGGAKKVPPASVYRTLTNREALRRDRKKRAIEMRRRTLIISNLTLDDSMNEKVKGVIENCYHCQIRFLQTKVGKRGILECRFNTVEDATKAEEELKEVVVEDRTIGIRNLEASDAPSTWYEVGRELDKYLKAGESGKDEDAEKAEKDAQDEDIAACDETKTLVLLNLPLTTTEEMLQAIFSEPQKIRMPLDNTGQCKGHAFLEFETAELSTECQTKYEGISIEDDQDDRQIYIQTLKEYKEKKAKAARSKRSGSRRRSSRDPSANRRFRMQTSRRYQMTRMRRGLPLRNRGGIQKSLRMNRGRDRNWGLSSPRNRGLLDKDRKRDIRTGRRDGIGFDSGMNWNRNMMWNTDMMSNMPNLLNMMSGMPASMMGINPFMGNTMNFQNQDNSNRNTDDYRNRKRKMDEPDFYRGDNRRGGGSGNWKNRRFENQDNYGTAGGSYGDRDRGNRLSNRDRNDNRGFRRYY